MTTKHSDKRKATSVDVARLEARRQEDARKALADARRLALHHSNKAGEAAAGGDNAISQTLMRLAEYFMRRVVELAAEVAAGRYMRAEHRKRYNQALNPGGRPKGRDLGAEWLALYETKKRSARYLTPAEIHDDIRQAYRQSTGTDYKVTYIKTAISQARAANRARAKVPFANS